LSADWQSMFGELIPLALVVALSPFSIVPAVLAAGPRGRRPG
jgi:hypothetical protein